MTIVHFSAADGPGGAWRAASRLHGALREAGVGSRMLVGSKRSDDEDVMQVPVRFGAKVSSRLRPRLPLPHRPRPGYVYSEDREVVAMRSVFGLLPATVRALYLHWIAQFLTVDQISRLWGRYRSPLLWVLHDQAPMTGGCHYSFDCAGYVDSCGRCPQLGSRSRHDRSHTVWKRKRERLRRLPIQFIAPSSWVAARLAESSLFGDHPVHLIPHAMNTRVFRPFDQKTARNVLGLPVDKKVIYVGASNLDDPRKGMTYLRDGLSHLRSLLDDGRTATRVDDIFVVVAGAGSARLLGELPFAGRALGLLADDVSLALAYQSADVFACPSVVDNAPLVIPESLLCGTPVVAFATGNAPDLIDHMRTGYVAAHRDSRDLGHGLHAILAAPNGPALRVAAAEGAFRVHTPATVAARHLELSDPGT